MFAGLSVLIVIGTIAVAVFVLPIGTWRDQDSDLVQRQAQLSELRRGNGELAVETQRLTSPNGIREAAREDYGFVEPGEERASILPLPPLPTKLPAGWPYNVVTEIADAKAVGPAVADETAPSDAAERNGG